MRTTTARSDKQLTKQGKWEKKLDVNTLSFLCSVLFKIISDAFRRAKHFKLFFFLFLPLPFRLHICQCLTNGSDLYGMWNEISDNKKIQQKTLYTIVVMRHAMHISLILCFVCVCLSHALYAWLWLWFSFCYGFFLSAVIVFICCYTSLVLRLFIFGCCTFLLFSLFSITVFDLILRRPETNSNDFIFRTYYYLNPYHILYHFACDHVFGHFLFHYICTEFLLFTLARRHLSMFASK